MLYLYGAWVGRFLVDALHQLVADAALVPLICRWGWITEIHLDKGGNKLMQRLVLCFFLFDVPLFLTEKQVSCSLPYR